jgi:hypothetical protein
MQASSEVGEIFKSLVKAQSEFSVIPKGADNPFFKSKYAALPDVVVAATPILSRNGLAISQLVTNVDGRDALTTVLLHESGQFISSTAPLHLVKNDPQAHGSAITYMRRYAYMAILGLVADEDEDGNAASFNQQQGRSNSQENSLRTAVASAAGRPSGSGKSPATEKQTRAIWAITHKSLNWNDMQMHEAILDVIGKDVRELGELTMDEAKQLIEHFNSLAGN